MSFAWGEALGDKPVAADGLRFTITGRPPADQNTANRLAFYYRCQRCFAFRVPGFTFFRCIDAANPELVTTSVIAQPERVSVYDFIH
jgi:hypothetical protein